MTYKAPEIISISNPVLLDKAISVMQTKFANLAWLEKIFGRAWRGIEDREGKPYRFPQTYSGDNEYYNLFPNDYLKAYCYFFPEDPREIEDIEPGYGNYGNFSTRMSIVVYFNLAKVDSSKTYRFNEELLQAIMNQIRTLNGYVHFLPERVYEEADSIFEGFDHKEIETQFLEHPWGGFRIEGTLKYIEECT